MRVFLPCRVVGICVIDKLYEMCSLTQALRNTDDTGNGDVMEAKDKLHKLAYVKITYLYGKLLVKCK